MKSFAKTLIQILTNNFDAETFSFLKIRSTPNSLNLNQQNSTDCQL